MCSVAVAIEFFIRFISMQTANTDCVEIEDWAREEIKIQIEAEIIRLDQEHTFNLDKKNRFLCFVLFLFTFVDARLFIRSNCVLNEKVWRLFIATRRPHGPASSCNLCHIVSSSTIILELPGLIFIVDYDFARFTIFANFARYRKRMLLIVCMWTRGVKGKILND